MRVFFSVGEPSGDQHAAHLITELRRRAPHLACCGYGGPRMERAGCRLQYQLTNLAVMGIGQVLPLLWRFYRLVKQAEREFRENPPDAVVLVDFPGFNWWIARKAKACGVPVFYYLPPQLWAWAPWRVKKVRRYVDYVLSGLSFEEQWYRERGIDAEYVGHPFFDEIAGTELDGEFLEQQRQSGRRVVAVLPGSRDAEIARNWPVMVDVIRRVHRDHPDVTFLVANYKPAHRQQCLEVLGPDARKLPVEFHVDRTSEIVELAECCLMVSGSVSLELLARETPSVVLYRAGLPMYLLARLLLTVRMMSLPNLMRGRPIMPEFPALRHTDELVDGLRGVLTGWLADPQLLDASRRELQTLKSEVVHPGATGRTAEAILGRIQPSGLVRAA